MKKILFRTGLAILAAGGLLTLENQVLGDPVTNAMSSYTHTVDGSFTGNEWSDITPLVGLYSTFYCDYDGSNFFVMNDWRVNTTGVATDVYNQFIFTANTNVLDFRVYGDGSILLLENGNPEPNALGAYFFGPSPNDSTNHTQWEIGLRIIADEWFLNVDDQCNPNAGLVHDPFWDEIWIDLLPDGGTIMEPVPEPAVITLLTLGGLAGFRLLWRRRS